MSKYIMRLDDACPRYDRHKWQRMEDMLSAYGVKPLVGIIPDCRDPMMDIYPEDQGFWDKVRLWNNRGWCLAMHGCDHVYSTAEGGLNPVNQRSEFAGQSLEVQREKISRGIEILKKQGIFPKVFFAPSHTFDRNTLKALEEESSIRIISDTVANAPYQKYGFTFVPQQSGRVRELKLDYVTFCYHPNQMSEEDFHQLEAFLRVHEGEFIPFPLEAAERGEGIRDIILRKRYFAMRKIRARINKK